MERDDASVTTEAVEQIVQRSLQRPGIAANCT